LTGLELAGLLGEFPEDCRPHLTYLAGVSNDRKMTKNQEVSVALAKAGDCHDHTDTAPYVKVYVPQPVDDCAVCGRVCGDLNGATKSWKCAGKIPALRAMASGVASGYTLEGKQRARTLAVQAAARLNASSVLDLWGGGTSAQLFRARMPRETAITSCEIDKTLWPAARLHAHENGYQVWCGDVANAPGSYDFVWLDFCGQWSARMDETLMRVARDRLAPGGHLAVTLMPAREGDGFVARSRAVAVPALLVVATRRPLAYIERYRRTGGHEMWMAVLGPLGEAQLDFVDLHDQLVLDTQWSSQGWMMGKRTRRGTRGSGSTRHLRVAA
jgi:SAM-dependent methyltransferase